MDNNPKSLNDIIERFDDPSLKAVSFDVLDTLLARPAAQPRDIHYLHDDEYNELIKSHSFASFTEERFAREEELRQRRGRAGYEEVTLDEIYDYLGETLRFPGTLLAALQALEIRIELRYLRRRESGCRLLEAAKALNLQIALVSDMYLPKSVIHQALQQNGIEIDPSWLYVSSEAGVKKASGKLFRFVLRERDWRPNELLHIGDNPRSDIEGARKAHVEAVYLPRAIEMFLRVLGNDQAFGGSLEKLDLGLRMALGLVANRFFDDPFAPWYRESYYDGSATKLGYYIFGILIFFLSRWMLDEAHREGYQTLYLLSRDGYMPKRIIELLQSVYKDSPKIHYIASSRNVFLPLSLDTPEKLALSHHYVGFNADALTIRAYLEERLGLQIDGSLRAELAKRGLPDPQSKIGKHKAKLVAMCMDMANHIAGINKQKTELARDYYRQEMDLNEPSACFDIGWRGSSQILLNDLLGVPLDFFYLACKSEPWREMYHRGYRAKPYFFFSNDHFIEFSQLPMLFESLFSNPEEGTVIGFKQSGDRVEPVRRDSKVSKDSVAFIKEAQDAMVAFTRDAIDAWGDKIPALSCIPQHVADLSLRVLTHPCPHDVSALSVLESDNLLFVGRTMNILEAWAAGASSQTQVARSAVHTGRATLRQGLLQTRNGLSLIEHWFSQRYPRWHRFVFRPATQVVTFLARPLIRLLRRKVA